MRKYNFINLLVILLSLFLAVGVSLKFFVFHQVPFKNFIIAFVFSTVTLVASFYTYLCGTQSINDIINRKIITKGDLALNIWAIVIGGLCLYSVFFIDSSTTAKIFSWLGVVFFLLGGILSLRTIGDSHQKGDRHR